MVQSGVHSLYKPGRLLMLAIVTLSLSACAGGAVRVGANGKTWGAPVGVNIHVGNSGYGHRHHRRGSRQDEPQIASSSSHQKIGRPYQVGGRTYVPARQDDYDETGIGSWYGPNFDGRKTANGEIFDQNKLTAAHPTLPLPSLVRVTNLRNGRQIIVRVNDRGPFVNNRLIDLSKASARELGYLGQGTTRVRVQYVGPATRSGGRFPVRRVSAKPRQAKVWPASARAQSYAKPAPYTPDQGWPEESKDKYKIALSRPRVAVGGWFVQAGAFSSRQRAEAVAQRIHTGGHVSVQTAWVNNGYIHRVLVGPYQSKGAAQTQRSAVADSGFPTAHVTEQR